MSPRSAKDVRDQLRSAAAGERQKASRPEEPDPSEPATPKSRRVRITVDLEREDHRALRRWVAEEETDAQRVIRALLGELFRDEKLAARVRAQVVGTRFR